MSDDLRVQYENYPYPPRNPADESARLIEGSPSHILEIEHHVFAGRRDRSRPFRALVAGGGTGDATVMIAQQHASAGIAAEVVHLDISEASIAVAEARVKARGLSGVRFVRGAIESAGTLGLGPFDYIDCCGVLHHLEDPAAGLTALQGQLSPEGGMGLMVYAPLGRTGVYHVQSMLRLVAGNAPDPERIETARHLLDQLPETSWFRRNPHVGDHAQLGDPGIYDLLLHRRDRSYSVPELMQLLQQGGMRPVNFVDPVRYEPSVYFTDPLLVEKTRALNWVQRSAFAELLVGSMKTHILYAVRADNRKNTLAAPDSPDAIPVMRDGDGPALGAQMKPGMSLTLRMDGTKLSLPLPDLAAEILARVDGARSLSRIHAAIASGPKPGLTWEAFKPEFDRLYGALYGLSRMFIRYPG